eukprot:181907-Chlamydomonas_euryale.AAC.1
MASAVRLCPPAGPQVPTGEAAGRAHPRNAHHQPTRGAMQRGRGLRHVVAAVCGRRPWPQVVLGAGGDRRKQSWRDCHNGAERPN